MGRNGAKYLKQVSLLCISWNHSNRFWMSSLYLYHWYVLIGRLRGIASYLEALGIVPADTTRGGGGIGQGLDRHILEWARSTSDGLTASSIFLGRIIHPFAHSINPSIHPLWVPTYNIQHRAYNLLDADNTILNSSVVHVIRCTPETEESRIMMSFPHSAAPVSP